LGGGPTAPPAIYVPAPPPWGGGGGPRFHRQPDDWTDPTTQVVVGLHDIEQNAILVRGNPHVSDLFSTPGKDWDLRVAVLMAFAGGPGWAVQWLRARHAQLIALPEEARWGALRDAIASIGRAYDRRLLANVETKVALAARITDAELLGAPAHEIAEERAPLEFDTPHSHAHAAYDRKAAVAYARKFAYRACSDGFMFLDDRNTRGEYVRLPDTATIVKDSDNADHVENADGTPFKLSDGTALTFHVMDDCTHFVSCCIGRPPGGAAGGIQVPVNTWGDPTQGKNPYGISRVSSLLTFVESLERRKVLRTVATKTDDDKKISLLEPGDVIAYFNTDAGEYTHLALYLGDGKIATHTVSRIDEPWALGRDRGFLWTLLHFVG
jgi:hypothetical protein